MELGNCSSRSVSPAHSVDSDYYDSREHAHALNQLRTSLDRARELGAELEAEKLELDRRNAALQSAIDNGNRELRRRAEDVVKRTAQVTASELSSLGRTVLVLLTDGPQRVGYALSGGSYPTPPSPLFLSF